MERYKVILSREAYADLRGVVRYLAVNLREPSTAESMLDRLEKAAFSLETMPERFALVSDSYLASWGIRMTSVGNYLLFYVADRGANEVNVLRILYGKRNWMEILKKTF